MKLDWNEGGLAEGLRCYQTGQFFEAHEHWEAVWLECAEPTRTFLQALIQITAAFHHLGRGNAVGAASLLSRALRRLDAFPPAYGGVDVDELRTALRERLEVLEREIPPFGLLPPTIVS